MSYRKNKQGFHVVFASLAFLLFVVANVAHGDDHKDYGDYPPETIKYLNDMFSKDQGRYAFRPDYLGGFEAWHREAQPLLRRLIALDKIAAQVGQHDPTVSLGEILDQGDYTRQRGWIKTEPHVMITFWLLKPKSEGPFPLAIFPHGHDKRGYDTSAGVYHDEAHRKKSLAGDRDVAVQAVKRGFVAIAPATRGLADGGLPDPKKRHGDRGCRAQFMHCLLAGRTAIGERVWDMQRLIDWATTLPDVDASHILMMGNSGGGVVTIYAAACDERITIAVPSCSYAPLISPNGYIYHCDCNMIPGILQLGDMCDVAGLIAPRRLLAVSGKKDALHSVQDINRAAACTHAIFNAANCPDHFEHRWGNEGHRFYKDLMWDFVMGALKNE